VGLLDILAKGVIITERPVDKKKPVTVQPYGAEQADEPPVESIADGTADDLETRQEKAEAILYGYGAAQAKSTPNATAYGYQSSFEPAFGGQTLGNQNILVCSPKNHNEIAPILENLWNKNPCVVNLDDSDTPQRHLDFLQGFVTAIHGTIKQIDPEKLNFILTPNGVGVK
jgi:FtsZ-interacting cell division protein YlmF